MEMLKHRFADTILRAEQHMLLAPGSKCNPVERKKLEKKYIKGAIFGFNMFLFK